jgi:phage shock protein A
MERVSTLIRANLNDLVDKAEDPEKMLKQVILDMENQMLQVKTQVAIAIADEHLLAKRQKENAAKVAEWMRKAEMAVDKQKDDLARAALDRVETFRRLGEALEEQVTDQRTHAEALKTALRRLDTKLAETRHRSDLLIAQHRRSRAVSKAAQAHLDIASDRHASADDRFEALERDDRIEQLLVELKSRRALPA